MYNLVLACTGESEMAAKENGEVSDAPTIRMFLPQRARIIGKKI